MQFEDPLFLTNALCGLSFLLAGAFMHNFPPKEINPLYGYRTRRSMKNQKNWEFAQEYSAKKLLQTGALLLISSILGLVWNVEESFSLLVTLAILILCIIYLFYTTETQLKRLENQK
ncbi:MAG: SdpI family protein [Weeksellaceae bacterium]|nr:SdpI family protein [Weeksellaceae bacterium]